MNRNYNRSCGQTWEMINFMWSYDTPFRLVDISNIFRTIILVSWVDLDAKFYAEQNLSTNKLLIENYAQK